ncbi:putative HTH-type transcriptional repressor ExuR [Halobacillus andaensis]|uniref:HTH-type transcriptional repressor ExuR n=1 Tax=Halobacillus andaensis TaxID=1176239 RepID=A0A917B4Y6_HALAA|nr:LacI family DNA-binding transcriptional regulator [Halobacillus andaensis]MBP2006050.1 LacI family transcriptional regulator [Halobacillus andaensis]GGF23991.1 putative HTH-type transcriptional repressor ExuR [Halobacillus andaensis]
MGVTIKDIAKTAGVSYSTVSKALRDSPLVKEPTKERIIQIAKQLGYQPNAAARSLVSKKSHTIGVVWPTIERVTHSALITGLNKQLEELSYTTLISINEMEFAINTFNRYQVDAIVAFDERNSKEPANSTVPIVTYGIADDTSLFPTVDVNRKQAIRSAVEYLTSIGHKKINYIGDLLQEDRLQEEKVNGFKQAIHEFDLDPYYSRIVSVTDLEQYDGYQAAKKLLNDPERPTALISGSHDLTKGILRAVYENGLSIPDDLSIISYDNIPATENFDIPLSTVGVPLQLITEKLAEVLMAVINEEEIDHSIYLEPELKITESCQSINGG